MVDLILETGTGILNANSYADLAFADEYFAGHSFYGDNWDAITDPEKKKSLLITASRDLDLMFDWPGTPATLIQGMRWPRYGATNIDGFTLPDFTIPVRLSQAVCEYAIYKQMDQASQSVGDPSGGLESLKIDVIELKFKASTASTAVPTAAARLLRGLGSAYGASRIRRVQVGLA